MEGLRSQSGLALLDPVFSLFFRASSKKWHDGIYALTVQHVTQQRALISLRPIKVSLKALSPRKRVGVMD